MNHDKTDTAQPVAGTDAVVQPWVDYWMKQYEQNTQWTQALMAGVPPQVEPEAIRKEWLGTMSKSIEAFMRTPTFLGRHAAKLGGDHGHQNHFGIGQARACASGRRAAHSRYQRLVRPTGNRARSRCCSVFRKSKIA